MQLDDAGRTFLASSSASRLQLELLLACSSLFLSRGCSRLVVCLSLPCTSLFFPLRFLEHEPSRAIWRVAGEECTKATFHNLDGGAASSKGQHCCKNRWIMDMSVEGLEGSCK